MEAVSGYPTAFVTYGWCRSAYTVVRSLASRGVEVHVGDSSRLALSRFSRYCSSFTRLPDFFAEPEAYVTAVAEAMQRTGAQVLLPCFEDVELFIRHRDRLPADTRMALPALENWTVAEDKLDYVQRVARAACPVPATWEVHSRDHLRALINEVVFPLVVKVRMGNGARGVDIVERPESLEKQFFAIVDEYQLSQDRWPILQQRLNGRKFKLDGVFCNGQPIGSGVYEILRCKGADRFGTSTFRVTTDYPELTKSCHAALAELNWHGMYNTDWICDDDGVPRLIDINGRLSGGVAVPYLGGMDLPWLWYQVSCGKDDFNSFEQRPDQKVRWLVGDGIGLIEHCLGGHFRKAISILKPQPGCRHDDFYWSDPLPLLGEAADYFLKFVRSRGSVRPDVAGMVR